MDVFSALAPPPLPAITEYAGYDRLVAEQRTLFKMVVRARESVFYTGSAGTGKTELATCIKQAFSRDGVAVAACAPTGQAAENLNGFTVHNLFGLKPRDDGCTKRKNNWQLRDTLRRVEVLLIDEVSMASEQLFGEMDHRLRLLRNDRRPFGGVQVVAIGDFLQLPPVGAAHTAARRYCFHSRAFTALFGPRLFRLQHQHRQAEDGEFAAALARIRKGEYPDDVKRLIESRKFNPQQCPLPEEVPHLYCRVEDVEACNRRGLDALPTPLVCWTANDRVVDESFRGLLNTCSLPAQIDLKVGAPVLLIKNADVSRRLVNGSRGTVTHILSQCELGLRTCQRPTCAVCAHGGTVQKFELIGEAPAEEHIPMPVVLFDNGLQCAVGRWIVEKHDVPPARSQQQEGPVLAVRRQIPLILGYALTVHKCQGMTLDAACVSLSRAFDCGQVYVALSRCRRLDSVFVNGYISASAIKAAPDAVEFDRLRVKAVAANAV